MKNHVMDVTEILTAVYNVDARLTKSIGSIT